MTVGEIWSVIWAKTRGSDAEAEGLDELYEDLKAAKAKEAEENDPTI